VAIPHEGDFLTGSYATPRSPRAAVIIANDRGCARHVPALRALARELRAAGFATLMVDVVSVDEHAVPGLAAHVRVSPTLLAARLESARAWLASPSRSNLPQIVLGMGGAAPAALLCAAAHPAGIAAVVACGPRPDAAGMALGYVSAPALLIAHAGQFDEVEAHTRALGPLGSERDLVVLDDDVDPVKRALDVARVTIAFLAFIPDQSLTLVCVGDARHLDRP
jgi:dienelactone hydrolase